MKYIVYQTTNLINNKIYIGVHKTFNPDVFDGYLGCGVSLQKHYYMDNPKTPFLYALKKYGFKNFKRTILQIFDTLEEALKLESELVNEQFIKRKDTYNIALGGGYGKTYYPINQFDKTGKLITTWDNMNIAAETLGVSHTSINNAKLYKGSCLGYFFSEENNINVSEYSYHVGNIVYQYNLDGDIVAQFDSVTKAAHSVGSKENAICRAINMHLSHKNYYWSYKLTDKFIPKTVTIKGKTVYLYDLEGNYITELLVGKPLKKYFNISSYGNIKEAIMLKKPFKGVQILLDKVEKTDKATIFSENKAKRIGRYSLDGELLQVYDSIKQATKEYGSGVYRVLNNRQEKTKNFIFRYLD